MPSLRSLNLSKHAVIFERALGDNIQMFYRAKTYQLLEHLNGENGKLNVILRGKYNPFIHEIFLNHPKRQFFNLGYEEIPIEYQGEIEVKRIDDYEEISQFDTMNKPIFYPLESDKTILETIPTDKPYVVFSACAGIDRTAEGENRSIPKAIAEIIGEMLLDLCEKHNYNLVLVGKTYHSAYGREEIEEIEGAINLVNKLSLAGTLSVVQKASRIVSTHSAFLVMAWEEKIKSIGLLPPSLYRIFIQERDFGLWGYGFAEPHSIGFSYITVTKQDLERLFEI